VRRTSPGIRTPTILFAKKDDQPPSPSSTQEEGTQADAGRQDNQDKDDDDNDKQRDSKTPIPEEEKETVIQGSRAEPSRAERYQTAFDLAKGMKVKEL
jgi:hypothetical protein